MPVQFDGEAVAAIDLAKQSLPPDGEIDAAVLLSALYYETAVRQRLPDLTDHLDPPEPRTDDPGEKPVAEALQPVLGGLATGSTVGAEVLFRAVAVSAPGQEFFQQAGMGEALIREVQDAFPTESDPSPESAESPWRSSPARAKAISDLSRYGRVFTADDLPPMNIIGSVAWMTSLVQALVQRTRRSALIVGPSGTGKTALVHEFARRLIFDDPSIPPMLRGRDVFELSPAFLRAGASVVGQYEERLKTLLEILTRHPNILLFVDEVHSLLQSGMHAQGPWAAANEEFKKAIGSGELSLIGCTTLSEYRHYIEPDQALVRRLTMVRLDPPSAAETRVILNARRESVESYYGLSIPGSLLDRTVELAEDYLLGRSQPAKSIQLLDEACAWCVVQDPPQTELSEEALLHALEGTIGPGVVRAEHLTVDEVGARLQEQLVGQDDLLAGLAHDVVAGMGRFKEVKGPRGNFFFAGPTGVGKTQTALALADIMGGGKRSLIRVDCNTLQGSGHDSRAATSQLLGPPPGYTGYVRGQGGILSRIRDTPDAVVLFDEIEKADPGVARTLLQILDEGTVDDADGNMLDFRRAFLIFTTNAGVTYQEGRRPIGFAHSVAASERVSTVSEESVLADLQGRGFPQEFLGRSFKWYMFSELDREKIPVVIERQLRGLAEVTDLRGYKLEWSDETVRYLAVRWEPRFGVRHLNTIVKNRITEQLSVAEAQGELDGVRVIRLASLGPEEDGTASVAGARRERNENTMIIRLA